MTWRGARGSFLIALLLTVTAFLSTLAFLPMHARAVTLYVGGTGPGNYTTVQAAIDGASPGDTVFVYHGRYVENVVVGKTISLVGEGRDRTIIDGGLGSTSVIRVTADWVNVTGFTVTNTTSSRWPGIELSGVHDAYVADNNASWDSAGILLYYASSNTVVRNSLSLNWVGIAVSYTSNGNTVADNVATLNDYGIQIQETSVNNDVTGNVLQGNYIDGVTLYLYCDGNDIRGNTITGNRHGGVGLTYYSHYDSVVGNVIADNEWGIYTTYASYGATIADNRLLNNSIAVDLASSAALAISNNTMVNNGIVIDSSVLEDWNTHTIDTSNTVNGKPVYYWRNVTAGTVPVGAGQVILANTDGVVIQGEDIVNASAAIQLGYAANTTVSLNRLSSNSQDGIRLTASDFNGVSQNSVDGNGNGIHIVLGTGNVIEGNNASFNSGAGILAGGWELGNIVRGNRVWNNTHGIMTGFESSPRFLANTVWRNQVGIDGTRAGGVEVANNTVFENDKGVAFDIARGDITARIRVTGNTIFADGVGIDIESSHALDVFDNTVSNCSAGIRISLSQDVNASGNVMTNDGLALYGFDTDWNSHSIDASNVVNGKPVYYWKGVVGGQVPPGAGEVILVDSTGVTVANQTLSHGDIGVEVGYSSQITIVGNSISHNNVDGVFLQGTMSGTVVRHNAFLNNVEQAHDGGSNAWDGGYPSGGNYWSGYGGVDLRSGPAQDLPGPDGIGDTPYAVHPGSVDRYPLIRDPLAPANPPAAPRNLLAVPGDSRVDLSWSAPASDGGSPVTAYSVYRGTSSGAETLLATVGNVLNYTDAQVANGQPYFYAVSATNGLGEGGRSNEVVATPGNAPPTCAILSPVANATVTGVVEVRGTASDSDGAVRSVEASVDEGSWLQVNGTSSWNYSWDTTRLANGQHTIRLRAYDGEVYSPIVSVTVSVSNPAIGQPGSVFEQPWVLIAVASAIAAAVVLYLLMRRRNRGMRRRQEGRDGAL